MPTLDCKPANIPASNHGGARPPEHRLWIILHSTEGDTAAGAKATFENPVAQVSTHGITDANECYHCLPTNVEAYQAGPHGNMYGRGLEFAAHAAWTKLSWMNPTHRRMLKKGAIIVARWALEDSIPLVYLTDPTQLQHMQKGITFHYVVSYAFHESTHTDPGQNFPKRTFMRMVKKQVKRIRAGK